ncbi:MAG: ATP-binding protein [Desulfomonilaceae bacterium]
MPKRFWSFSWLNVSLKFLVVTSIAITLVFTCLFFWLWKRQEDQIMEQVRKQAIILYNQLVLTRGWVAEHETLIQKRDDNDSSGSLYHEPYMKSPDGKLFVKINPSILTAELSERASKRGLYFFKLTNTDCLNPKNAPDDLEKQAINTFRNSSQKEIFKIDFQNSKPVMRYIAPVYVTQNCLTCHSGNGYKAGAIGGCLSIFIPMDEARKAIQKNAVVLFTGVIGFGGILIGLLFVSTRSLLLSRIREIKSSISRINIVNSGPILSGTGDELKEISDFCYLIDTKLKEEHAQLEKRIRDATRDLFQTKENLEKANKELEQLNRAKSEFFSDISHELRTPLTNIKGAVDIMERTSNDSSKYVEIIKRNSEHLIKLVVDLLDYSRIEAGRLELELGKTRLKELLSDVVVAEEAQSQKKNLIISIETEELILEVDRDRIYQVLTNLLANAIRFSPVGGIISIEAKAVHDSEAMITINDQGPGIDEKYREAIFQKFYQAPIPQNSMIKKGSSGIGLAICRALIEAHGGKIWVESQVGAGSKFCFTAPRWVGDEQEKPSDRR